MRYTKILLVMGLMLAIPLIGKVQQLPGEVTQTPPASLAQLRQLVKTQTEAIQALHDQVKELELRVEKLERAKPTGDSH